MEYKSNEIKAGIFIFISLVLFFGFLFIITGLDSWSEKSEYRARFSYVGGIEKGSSVRFSGVEVGKVTALNIPNGGRDGVELVMEVETDTPIKKDSEAFLTTIGIMGAFYVEITSGSVDSAFAEPGSLLKSKDVTGFAQMSGTAANATSELTELLVRVNDLLNDKNRQHISSSIRDISESSAIIARELATTIEGMNKLVSQTEKAVNDIDDFVQRNDTAISNSFETLDTLLVNTNYTVNQLNHILDNVDFQVMQNRNDMVQAVDNLSALTKNLNEFSQMIKEQPWLLVRRSYPPERRLAE